jgi:hypothetical protein
MVGDIKKDLLVLITTGSHQENELVVRSPEMAEETVRKNLGP